MAVKGADGAKEVSAVMLDYTHDDFPVDVRWCGDKLTLVKPDKNSAAFLVTFEY